jgi:hypothetical protein
MTPDDAIDAFFDPAGSVGWAGAPEANDLK